MTTTPTQWKRDARRIRELLETAQALAKFDPPQQTNDAVTCLQQVTELLEKWQNINRAELATMNYKADALRRTNNKKGTTQP